MELYLPLKLTLMKLEESENIHHKITLVDVLANSNLLELFEQHLVRDTQHFKI